MAKALKTRFKGHEKEKIEQLELMGWRTFCAEEPCGYDALQHWLQQQLGHENDSIYRYTGLFPRLQDLPSYKQLALAIQRMCTERDRMDAHYKTIIEQKDRRIESLSMQMRSYRLGEYRDLKPLFDIVKPYLKNHPIRVEI